MDLKRQADQLETANSQLMRFDDVKSAFLNTVSHDLRTPLTSIRGFAKLIKRDFETTFCCDDIDAERRQKIGDRISSNLCILDDEGRRLTRLINDFLDLSKMESGNMNWRDESTDLAGLVKQVLCMAEGFYEGRNIRIHIEVEQGLPPVMVDGDRVIQVLVNLISNACKYTEEGTVSIRAFSGEPGHVTVEVEDNGIGIPHEEQLHVFDKFHQVETGNTLRDTAKGTGLGLAICKEIIDHYNGKIWVESAPGVGSVFAFSLPTH